MTALSAGEVRRRGRLLWVVLAATRLPFPARAVPAVITTLREWLDSWSGIGRIAVGMARQGYDLQLTRYGDEGWRATFYPAGRAHSVVSGTAWERTPWHAVQGAAWEALKSSDVAA